jgi:hypothetical protein
LFPFGQQTWLLLPKIEHMVKLHVFGNNSKTVNNIRNLKGLKIISTARSKGPYIDAFCQVWFHLVQLFQRSRVKYEKLTDGRRFSSSLLKPISQWVILVSDWLMLKNLLL